MNANKNRRSHGYVFILTPIELKDSFEFEIIPKHKLVRAKTKQIAVIKEKLHHFNKSPLFLSPYENNISIVPGKKPGDFSFPHKPLPRGAWRYWIIEFEGINSELFELGCACKLISNDFDLGFEFTFHGGLGEGFGWDPNAIHSFFDAAGDPCLPKSITEIDLREVGRIYSDIKNLSPDSVHIRRALQRFDQIKWLPRRSEMVTIGLFSVIESLVSHAPKLTESADSLSHQLRTKLPMLRKKFHPSLNHANFFSAVQEETLWNKLYAYRSKVVHGEDSQFSGELTVLKDLKSVVGYLRETAKRLLALSLREPQFMTDLKKC